MKKLILFGLILTSYSFAAPDETPNPCANLAAPSGHSATALSVAEFRALPLKDRQETLEGWNHMAKEPKVAAIQEIKIEFNNLDPNLSTAHLNAAERLMSFFQQETDTDISNEVGGDRPTVSIGNVTYTVTLYVHPDGTILGGFVFARQAGGDYLDPQGAWEISHFETEAEAIAAGVDVKADVSWTGQATYEFDPDGKIMTLKAESRLEWAGY